MEVFSNNFHLKVSYVSFAFDTYLCDNCVDERSGALWKSVLGMCELFGNVAQFVGEKLGWEYNEKEGKSAHDFLEYVHQLPKNRL